MGGGDAQTTHHLHPPPLNLLSTHMLLDAHAIYNNVSHFSKFFASDFNQNIQGTLKVVFLNLAGSVILEKKEKIIYCTVRNIHSSLLIWYTSTY